MINIDTNQVKELISTQGDSLLIVDVRESFEYEAGHIPEAILIPLGDVLDSLDKLPKDKTILFVCRSGRRSLEATNMLLENGYEEVFNYKGGMLCWDGEVEIGLE